MTNPVLSRARIKIGAGLLAVNALLYVVAEAITAAAWQSPAYSYSYNYISDLGVPDLDTFEGRVIDSPLHWVMNTGFVVHGVLFVLAILLLRDVFVGKATRRTIVVLAFVHGIGIALVGLFHGSQQAVEDGTSVLHGAGALLAIIGGNAAFITAGIALIAGRVNVAALVRSRVLGGTFVAFGVLGIAAFGYLLATAGSAYDGIPERIAVYTVMAAEIIAATALISRTGETRNGKEDHTSHRRNQRARP